MALRQRQAAGVREDVTEVDGLVVDRHAMLPGEIEKGFVAEKGPGRSKREVIVDGAGHGCEPELEACSPNGVKRNPGSRRVMTIPGLRWRFIRATSPAVAASARRCCTGLMIAGRFDPHGRAAGIRAGRLAGRRRDL